MAVKKQILITGLILSVSLNLIAENLPSEQYFDVTHNGLTAFISSGDLELSVKFQKPGTVPQASETGSWILTGETSVYKLIGGRSGRCLRSTYSTGTGLVDNEGWISDLRDLVALRQTFTNKLKKW